MLVELGIRVRNKTLALDSLPLIKTCFNAWLGRNRGCLPPPPFFFLVYKIGK